MEANSKLTFALLAYGEEMKRMSFLCRAFLSVLINKVGILDLQQPSRLQKFKQNHIQCLLVDAFALEDVAQLVNN